MAIAHRFTILCDEVRQENNGKFLVIGMYTPGITVPQVPFALPSLTFFTALDSDTPTQAKFNFRLQQGATVIAGGSGQLNTQRGMAVVPIRLGPLQLMAAGDYSYVLEIEGAETITHDFSVTLRVPHLGNPPVQGTRGVH